MLRYTIINQFAAVVVVLADLTHWGVHRITEQSCIIRG